MIMDSDESGEQCSSGSRLTFDEKQQARDKSQIKKSRQNFDPHESNGFQGAGSRPKQRLPGNLTANGICAADNSRKFNNNGLNKAADAADPYSVAYNVDSKTNIDKCLSLKKDCADRRTEGFSTTHCSWSLENILSQSGQYQQQTSCEDNNIEVNCVKINNTENDPVNGVAISVNPALNVNNIESQYPNRNCSQGKTASEGSSLVNRNDFNINVPSGSNVNGAGPSREVVENGALAKCSKFDGAGCEKPNRKRPANRRQKRSPAEAYDSSSDTGNDDYSVGSDECCIYTYRGGEHLADLPSSFFSLDMGLAADSHLPAPPLFGPRPEPLHEDRAARDSGASSPDMDYLEMDFDPGPSGEADSNDESSLDLELDPDDPPAVDDIDENVPEIPLNVVNKSFDKQGESVDVIVKEIRTEIPRSSRGLPDTSVSSEVKKTDSKIPASKNIPSDSVGTGFSTEPSTSRTSFPGACKTSLELETSTDRCSSCQEVAAAVVNCEKIAEDQRPYGNLISHTNLSGEVIHVRRTSLSWPARETHGHHSSSGDLVSPGETCEGDLPESLSWASLGGISLEQGGMLEPNRINLASALFHCTMAKRLVVDKQSTNFLQEQDTSNVDGAGVGESGEPPAVAKCMLWSEQEACSRQVTQIGTSACGASSVINALLALHQTVDLERLKSSVCTRQRSNAAPLCRYLVSRALAGCGVRSLAAIIDTVSGGVVSSRHFSTWPERSVPLSHWLANWIGLGAVPIATLNLQAGVADPSRIPDSWHHQMIFGVGPRGIYMANPVECVEEGTLWHQLCSDSVLLIKRKDVLSRWTRDTDLSPLMSIPGDQRWRTMNVLGQVVNIIRESHNSASNGQTRTTHVRIPACYQAGITVVALAGSEAHRTLLRAPELPLLVPQPLL